MSNMPPILVTLYTLATGFAGAALGYWLSAPIYVLIGPAVLISLLSLTGIRFAIADQVRDVAFLVIGIGIGSGVNSDVTAALLHWPLAFVTLAISLLAIMLACRFVPSRVFGLDHRSAVMASTPGHLSFVLSMSAVMDLDLPNIIVIQSIRLLVMTLIVPFAALFFGFEVGGNIFPPGTPIDLLHLAPLVAASFVAGLILKRFNVPAAMLMGAMIVSVTTHLTELTPGTLSPEIAFAAFVTLGTLIGTRFSGISLTQLKSSALAGLTTTLISAAIAALAAVPIAMTLGMPMAHVLVAFAPGGFETMVAMGVVLGASPGFVAACHVVRLLVLPVLVPIVLGRRK